jgi:hypothetical protein
MLDINKIPIFPFNVENVQQLLFPYVAQKLITLPQATGNIDFRAIAGGLLPSGEYFFCTEEGQYQFLVSLKQKVPVTIIIEVEDQGTTKDVTFPVEIPFDVLLKCGGSKSTFQEFFTETSHEQVQQLFLEVMTRKAQQEMKNLAN